MERHSQKNYTIMLCYLIAGNLRAGRGELETQYFKCLLTLALSKSLLILNEFLSVSKIKQYYMFTFTKKDLAKTFIDPVQKSPSLQESLPLSSQRKIFWSPSWMLLASIFSGYGQSFESFMPFLSVKVWLGRRVRCSWSPWSHPAAVSPDSAPWEAVSCNPALLLALPWRLWWGSGDLCLSSELQIGRFRL